MVHVSGLTLRSTGDAVSTIDCLNPRQISKLKGYCDLFQTRSRGHMVLAYAIHEEHLVRSLLEAGQFRCRPVGSSLYFRNMNKNQNRTFATNYRKLQPEF